jgi:ribosome biogenesis GTPase A
MQQNEKNVHWFPGHMKKAAIRIEEQVKLVDFIIILLDSRIPISSKSELLEKIAGNKKKLYVLTKVDLSDDEMTKKWLEKFNNNGDRAIGLDLTSNASKKELVKVCGEFASDKKEKYLKKGIKNIGCRAMVLGIPNVGKSTLINLFASKHLAETGNIPGVTKNITWVKVGNFQLMDVPGILEPNYKDKNKAINLALIGSMKESILPTHDLCISCVNFLLAYYKKEFIERYGLDATRLDYEFIINEIAKKRGYLSKGDILDTNKCELNLLNEFRNGKITKFTLERI